MTSHDDLSRRLSDHYIAEAPTRAPDWVLGSALATIDKTRQRRVLLRPSWRFPIMSTFAKAAIAAVAVIVVLSGLVYIGGSRAPSVGGGVNASPSPIPTPSLTETSSATPSAAVDALDTATWRAYTSSQYTFDPTGYGPAPLVVGHPPDWTVDPASRAWVLDTDAADRLSPAMDDFSAPTGDVRVSVWSAPVGLDSFAPTSEVGAWIERYCRKTGSSSCAGILDGAVPLCVERRDCHPGLLVGVSPPFDRDAQAFFTGGIYDSEMVVVTLWREKTDLPVARYDGGRRLIEAFLSTMGVWPESTPGDKRLEVRLQSPAP